MSKPFTPRPIYRVKDYRYAVEEGDTPSAIAKRFRQGPSAVRELVAANLYGRVLQPQTLGSPFSFRTFAALEIGESLKIPAHWPDPVGMLAGEAEAKLIFDPIFAGIAQQFGAVQAASGGQAVPPAYSAAVTNAAIQWWLQTKGGVPAADPKEYMPYVTSAVAWVNTFAGPKLEPAQAQAFPWAVLLAMLPPGVDPTTVTWDKSVIPGTPGIRWADLPWSYIGGLAAQLETLKLPPIAWPPAPANPLSVLAAFQQAIGAATFDAHTCGKNAEKGPGGKCYCQVGYEWASSDPAELDCKPEASTTPPPPANTPPPTPSPPSTKPGGSACPPDTTFDAAGPNGANCYGCPPGYTYSTTAHACQKPATPAPAPPSTPPPAVTPADEKKDNTTLYVVGGIVLAAIAAVTIVATAKPDMLAAKDKEAT